MERFYLTTPIYYVNSTPHIGHAYTTVAADVFARHQRQRGRETFLLTGVDEHASKVARVAAEQGLAPQEYVDGIVVGGRSLPARLDTSYDFFIRTSDEGQ
jgi:methionyl-tRNA synthetase